MFSDIGDVSSIQRDGRPPTVVTAGAAPGESGVAVMHLRYQGGAYLHADLRQHFVTFATAGPSTLRVAGKTLQHEAVEAGLCIFPAGIDVTVDCESDVRSLLIAIDPDCLALASAEDSAAGAQLIERSYGHDESLGASANCWPMNARTAIRAGRCSGTRPRAGWSQDLWPATRRGSSRRMASSAAPRSGRSGTT